MTALALIDDLVLLELRLPQVEDDAAHQREGAVGVLDDPAPTRLVSDMIATELA